MISISKLIEKVEKINPNNHEGSWKYIDIASVDRFQKKIVLDSVSDITADSAPSRARQLVLAGDIIISTVRPNLNTVAIVPKELDGAIASTGFCVLRPNKEMVDTKYLFHYIKSDDFVGKLVKLATGANYPAVSDKIIKEQYLKKISLCEQKNIAAILDKAEGIRQKREQAIKLADDFLRATFLEMFSNEKIKIYPITKVDNILAQEKNSIRTGPFGSQLLHSEFTESGIAVLGIDNAVKNDFQWGKPRFISQSKYETLKRYTVFPGDVIVTIMGTCGRCAVVPDDIPTAINTKHLCCISLDKGKCIPEFLHSYFLTHPLAKEYLAKHSKGAIMDGLNMGVIKHMPFPKIPIEQQCEFVNFKEKIKRLKSKINSSKIDCEYNFTTLCNDIFNIQG
ncbi:restriction endonuclease subunit S [Salmonella enterica]|nr:restriction endonuclease subunit S [Salmonella enterica]EGO6394566.1 restriction endonuclease subunit S [Salmonella enterica]